MINMNGDQGIEDPGMKAGIAGVVGNNDMQSAMGSVGAAMYQNHIYKNTGTNQSHGEVGRVMHDSQFEDQGNGMKDVGQETPVSNPTIGINVHK